MKIYEGLNIKKGPVIVSIIGGGGKTSTMLHLAEELKQIGKKVLITTTTHISIEQGKQMDRLIVEDEYTEAIKKLKTDFEEHSVIGLSTMAIRNKKLKGIPPEWVERLKEEKIVDVIIVEADGARGRSFKAPGENEPVLPKYNDIVVSVIGIDVLNQPITDEYVHRPDVILGLLGKEENHGKEKLHIENIARIFKHKKGPLKNIQDDVHIFVLINKVGDDEEGIALTLGNYLAKEIDRAHLRVLIGQVQDAKNPIKHTIEGRQ